MADEFAKGLGAATVGGLGWMVMAGWYNTPDFFSEQQMYDPTPANLDVYGQLSVVLRDAFLAFTILSILVFWFLLPAYRQARASYAE